MATGYEEQTNEAPLEPDLVICDPHHHLRERPNDRYFLEEFVQDTNTGTILRRRFVWKTALSITRRVLRP